MTAALSDEALDRLAAARRTAAGLEAVAELAELLGDDQAGRWAAAGRLEHAIRRFESAAYRRISTGARPPQGRAEELLVAICSAPGLPRCRRRLFDLLR